MGKRGPETYRAKAERLARDYLGTGTYPSRTEDWIALLAHAMQQERRLERIQSRKNLGDLFERQAEQERAREEQRECP